MQLFASLLLVYGANLFGVIDVDPITWRYLKPYLIYTIAFSLGVYTNMMSLNTSNVETVIVFRALSPLVVSQFDYFLLGRELPSKRSLAALLLITVGAIGYALTDEAFITQGASAYFWPFLYLFLITFEMVYGKKIVQGVKFDTMSGPVQYTNLLGWPPMIVLAELSGEFTRMHQMMAEYDVNTVYGLVTKMSVTCQALVVLGCIIGTGIGYTGWWCRSKVSATSYTLIGVINKCLTVFVNILIWDQHATPEGIASLFLCLIGGSFYQQAPMRKDKVEVEVVSSKISGDDEDVEVQEQEQLLKQREPR